MRAPAVTMMGRVQAAAVVVTVQFKKMLLFSPTHRIKQLSVQAAMVFTAFQGPQQIIQQQMVEVLLS